MDQNTIGKVADATGEVAKTADTALKLVSRFGSAFEGALNTAGSMIENEIKFIAARRALRLSDRWETLMEARGLAAPTRPLPPNFAVPLLTTAVLEEDDELQDTWARLLVNAGECNNPDGTADRVCRNPEGNVGLRCEKLGGNGEGQLSDAARKASGGVDARSTGLIEGLSWALHETPDNISRAWYFAGKSLTSRVRYACWRNGRGCVVYNHDRDRSWSGAISSVFISLLANRCPRRWLPSSILPRGDLLGADQYR